jgi:hypothetical protein
MSSFSGVASFGTTSFPTSGQKYVSIVVGIINISIAMLQTYESYLKIGDIVSKSLTVSTGLKKLADDIYCEIFIPVEDRETAGVTFLRDCFSRYQAIIDNAPPLVVVDEEEEQSKKTKHNTLISSISSQIRRRDYEERVEFGKTFRPTSVYYPQNQSQSHVSGSNGLSNSAERITIYEDHVVEPHASRYAS